MLYSKANNFSQDFSLEITVTSTICKIVNTPRSLCVYLLAQAGEWQQLVDLDIDPRHYEDPQHFAEDSLVTKILSKSTNLPLGIDQKSEAIASFYLSEASCLSANKRLFQEHDSSFSLMQSYVQKVLGPLSHETLRLISRGMRFGPGVTTGVKGVGLVMSDKYKSDMHLTQELIPFYKAILGERWWEHQREPQIVKGNKFTTVPKNAKTDRGICIEPTLNVYAQLGLGTFLKSRLKRFGVDLFDQSRNQYLAKVAMRENLCTVDLSRASDSLCIAAVFKLLPPRWFELFDLFRSKYTTMPSGEDVTLEKFSSMGNGFTFELESLIFSSIVYSIVPKAEHHLCGIYGDDLIFPRNYADDIIERLNFLGFSVNSQKSFLAGNFFESCGSDWFKGQSVRPFYLRKGDSSSKAPYALQIANSLRHFASQQYDGEFCDMRFKELWLTLRSMIGGKWRHAEGPPAFGDSLLHVSEDELTVNKNRSSVGLEGRYVRYVLEKPVQRYRADFFTYLAAFSRAGGSFSVSYSRYGIPEKFVFGESSMTKGFQPRRGFLRSPVLKWGLTNEPLAPYWV